MSDSRRLPYLKQRLTNQGTVNQATVEETKPLQHPPVTTSQQSQPRSQIQQQPPPPTQTNSPPPSQQTPAPAPAPSPAQKKPSRIDTEIIPRPICQADKTITYEKQQKFHRKFLIQSFKTTAIPLYHTPQSHQYFIVEDDGNTSPRYMRCSMYALGNEPSITSQTDIPLGCIVQPLADPGTYEESIPMVEFSGEPIRCQRCKAYVNPFFTFCDQGNSYICNLCKMKNPVPNDYFSPLGNGNQRSDRYSRFELCKGAYEIVAPPEYIKKPIANILTLFCIELTPQSVQKGIFLQILTSLQSILDSIPCPEKNDIAIITYDQRMHFYNIPQNLAGEPQVQ